MTDTVPATAFIPPEIPWAQHVAQMEAFLKAEQVVDWNMERCGEDFFAVEMQTEMAHPSCLIGPWKGPVGTAASVAFAGPSKGFTPMMAIRRPTVKAPIFTVVVNEVTINGADMAVLVGGPLQRAAADAVTHCIQKGILPKEKLEQRKLAIVFQGFVHWESKDVAKVYWWNYRAMVQCIVNAVTFAPSTEAIVADTGKHGYCDIETATV